MIIFLRIALFHTRQLLRTPFFVQQAILSPLSFSLFRLFGSWGAGVSLGDDLWFDAALAGVWATTTTAVGIIGFQRFQGTLEHLFMSVLPPRVVFGSLCAAASLLGLISVPLTLLFQLVVTGGVSIDWRYLVAFVLGGVACLASAFSLASIFVLSRTATVYEPLILTPIWLLTGLVIPLTGLPAWVMPIAAIHPLTGAVQATRTESAVESLFWMGESLLASVLWLVLSGLLLAAAMRKARISGSLALA